MKGFSRVTSYRQTICELVSLNLFELDELYELDELEELEELEELRRVKRVGAGKAKLKTRKVFENDKFVKLIQGRERYLKIEIMLLSIYSFISKKRRIVCLNILMGKTSVDGEMNSKDISSKLYLAVVLLSNTELRRMFSLWSPNIWNFSCD